MPGAEGGRLDKIVQRIIVDYTGRLPTKKNGFLCQAVGIYRKRAYIS